MLFEHHYCGIKCYLPTKSHFDKWFRYVVQMFVPIIMYGLGLFLLLKQKVQCLQNFKYDVTHRVHELHISAKFHNLI